VRCAAPQSRRRTGGPVTVCRGCAHWHARRAVECGRAAGSERLVHHAHGVVVVVVDRTVMNLKQGAMCMDLEREDGLAWQHTLHR
jgi:hypothetical protein